MKSLSSQPFTGHIEYPADLPIAGEKEAIIEAIRQHPVVVIAGDTGSGKTTQLPKMCLEAGRGQKGLIGCTQPRRIAAVSVAARVAEELGDANGHLVGHKIRFQDRTSAATRIKFMTDGILLAETQRDRRLSAYDTIIIDEAHERSLNIDFLLGILKRLVSRRKDLKVIITSATIDTEKFSKSFANAPVIAVSGRMYPVDLWYRPLDSEQEESGDVTYIDQAVDAVLELRQKKGPGDILVFMPTERDIRETADSLQKGLRNREKNKPSLKAPSETTVLPLFGRLSAADQGRIFRPAKGQKIVVATNVAETSITVPGIRYVVDTGLARIATYNVRARTHKLPIVPVSRASCDQRKGRCGRTGAGVCVRLYGEDSYLNRTEFTRPEIQRSNLAEVILRMISLKLGDPETFPFIDPPSPRAIKDGYNLLTELGAIDRENRLTTKGRIMARLPLDPRVSRMIIEARGNNAVREVAIIAAALSIQDPRVRPAEKEAAADAAHERFVSESSDFLSFLKIWDAYHDTFEKIKSQSRMRKFCKSHFLSYQRMREWRDIHEQIRSILKEEEDFHMNRVEADADAIHRAILSGNLRNLGLKKTKNAYQGAQGRELTVFPGSALFNKGGQWIMAAELVETSKLFARTVATIKPEWIEDLAAGLCRSSFSSPHWEKNRGQVVALEKVTLFGLVIVAGRKVNFGRIKPDEARWIFIQTALVEGELKGNYGFFEHNRKLAARLRDMEDRVRQRDILVDDSRLYEFYDRRLDQKVWDQAGLNRLLKKKQSDDFLRMTEEDVLNRPPAKEQLEKFPEILETNGLKLKLSYRFEPAAEDDGVTVTLPVDLVPHLSPAVFEWLVPGLLLDKITFLLKGLPKSARRQLIPIPQTAERLLSELAPEQGSLYKALEDAVEKVCRCRVERQQWPIANLPDHFRMRYRLTDAKGKTLKISRTFAEFGGGSSAPVAAAASLKQQWEREGITTWDFAELPERIAIRDRQGELSGFAYPALVPCGRDSVAVRLCGAADEQRMKTRQGLLVLYVLQFRQQLKKLKKDFSIPKSHWALYEGIASHDQMQDDLFSFILEEIFGTREGSIPSREKFEKTIAAVREEGLFNLGRKIMDQVLQVLRERRETLDTIARFEAAAGKGAKSSPHFQALRDQVRRLLPQRFLQTMDYRELAVAPRYLKALRIRAERAHAAPAKDAVKAAQVAPFEQRLHAKEDMKSRSMEQDRLLVEYRQMLEEFKISLFAQEIKTLFPVSAKRLEKKWKELERCG